jgi:hypothetical protein
LPGRNPTAAREAFIAPLRRSLSCFTDVQMFVTGARTGEIEALTLSEDTVKLSSGLGRIQLSIGHNFRVIEDSEAGYRVTTAGYIYSLLGDDDRELLGWHWHPTERTPRPHLHMQGAEPVTHKVHIPTGRVTIESVLRMLAEDLSVTPKRDDWADVLHASERPHLDHRTWSG